MIAAGAVSFPEPDLSNIAVVAGWIKVAHLAEAHNLPVTRHGVHDLHRQLLAAVPIASERPGHGVQLNWSVLERHRART